MSLTVTWRRRHFFLIFFPETWPDLWCEAFSSKMKVPTHPSNVIFALLFSFKKRCSYCHARYVWPFCAVSRVFNVCDDFLRGFLGVKYERYLTVLYLLIFTAYGKFAVFSRKSQKRIITRKWVKENTSFTSYFFFKQKNFLTWPEKIYRLTR